VVLISSATTNDPSPERSIQIAGQPRTEMLFLIRKSPPDTALSISLTLQRLQIKSGTADAALSAKPILP